MSPRRRPKKGHQDWQRRTLEAVWPEGKIKVSPLIQDNVITATKKKMLLVNSNIFIPIYFFSPSLFTRSIFQFEISRLY